MKEVTVRSGPSGFAQEIDAGGHRLSADEPVDLGGTDLGPSPYELLLAALGACTSMTLRMYATRKQWPLERVNVHLSHNKIHARDCEDCGSEVTGYLDRIERHISLEGELSDEQRQRLLEIADKCPVHKTLKSTVHIASSLVP